MRTTCLLLLLLIVGSVLAANETPGITNLPEIPAKYCGTYYLHNMIGASGRPETVSPAKAYGRIEAKQITLESRQPLKVLSVKQTLFPDLSGNPSHPSLAPFIMIQFEQSDLGLGIMELPDSALGITQFTYPMNVAKMSGGFSTVSRNKDHPPDLSADRKYAINDSFKVPSYLDCWSNSVTLYPGAIKVNWESIQEPGNPVEKFLDQIQFSNKTQYVVVMARPDSVTVFRQVRKMIAERAIDAGYDPVDAGFQVSWKAGTGQNQGALFTPPPVARQSSATTAGQPLLYSPPPMAHIVKAPNGSEKQPMFFECRNNQVFYVDKTGLDEKLAKVLSSLTSSIKSGDPNGFVKAINANEIGNEYYKVSPSYLLAMIMALEPKPGVRGDNQDALPDSNSNFQKWLQKVNFNNSYLVFLVRDDSFNVFRHAREIAEKIGFDVGWELLDREEPIKFGTGGQVVPAK